MTHENMIEHTTARDFIPIFSGHEICQKEHKFGPHVRNYYIIHYFI